MFIYNLWVLRLYMSSYGMFPYVFVYFIVHTFGISVVALL